MGHVQVRKLLVYLSISSVSYVGDTEKLWDVPTGAQSPPVFFWGVPSGKRLQKAMEQCSCLMGKLTINGSFSIAMLVI